MRSIENVYDDRGYFCRVLDFGPVIARIPVSSTGRFSYTVNNLKPGKYQIIVQNLSWGKADGSVEFQVPFLTRNGKVLVIEIPDRIMGAPIIDAGKVQVPLPPYTLH